MIQHVVVVNFRNGVPESSRRECVSRLRSLPATIPGLRQWRVGVNRTELSRAWDLSVTAEFDTIDDVIAYRAHPAHLDAQAFVDQFAADTIGVDFDPND